MNDDPDVPSMVVGIFLGGLLSIFIGGMLSCSVRGGKFEKCYHNKTCDKDLSCIESTCVPLPDASIP